MNISKKYFWFIIITGNLVAICLHGMAQSTNPSTNTNSTIIPPPPNVASFLKEANVPVSNYNGTEQVTIPLYTLEEGDLKIPLSVSYYNNGLKVNEEASWVGFGWNLNAGGVIHQNIVGNPDGSIGSPYVSTLPLPNEMPPVSNSNIYQSNFLEHGCTYLDDNYSQQYFSTQIINNQSLQTGGNNEYDLFMYNFGGYSGKFIYPNYPTTGPVLLDRNNIKFNYDGTKFTATTPDGAQYIFSAIGTSTTPMGSCFITTPIPAITSYSWYLTQIISPNGNAATFTYKKYTSSSLPVLSQSFTENQTGGSGTYLASQGFYADFIYSVTSGGASINDNTTLSSSQEDNLILQSIQTAHAVVVFNTSTREDVDQGVKLDNISVYRTGETSPFKAFQFTYSYFTGSPVYGDWTTNSNVVVGCLNESTSQPPTTTLAERSERLKLNAVQMLGSNFDSEPPYQFIYDNSPTPYKTSLAQDLWGYFNGWTNNSLLPDYNQIGYFDANVPLNLITSDFSQRKQLAVRKAIPQFMQAGILKQIINPTGGYTKITYEPNQFSNLPATSSQIRDTLLTATNSTAGNTQIVFDIPDIGYQGYAYVNGTQTITSVNPVTLYVRLTNPNSACSISPGFNGYDNSGNNNNANSLYDLLEVWDPVHQIWTHTLDNIFDFSTTTWQTPVACTTGQTVYGSTISKQLVPGHYRITANYPDDETGGLPQPSASIAIDYKYVSTQQYPNYGGGLRVKSVTDYTDASHIYNQKIYTYYSGKLMTKPIFYRNSLSFDMEYRAYIAANQPQAYAGQVSASCAGGGTVALQGPQSPFEIGVASLSLYSNPLLNYSYGASGAAVGYDSVKVDYSVGKDIGESVYVYTNMPDNVLYYPELLPGTPGGSYLLNGSLETQKELRKNSDGTLSPLRQESNSYIVNNFRDYWAYKSEYIQPYTTCGPGTGTGMFYNYLHFYPVKAGKVLLSSRSETHYDSAIPYTINTNYQYNAQNQLSQLSATTSDGRTTTRQTYYPGDYNVSSGFISQMQTKNMIDYPIEVINNVTSSNGTSSTLTSSASYKQYYQHDGSVISPLNSYLFNSVSPVAIMPSVPNGTMDSHYELRESYNYGPHGDLISYQKANGPVTSYLWDYNGLYPVAKITNTNSNDFAYTSFEADASGNWNYSGAPTLDSTCPTGQYCYSLSNGSISNGNLSTNKTYVLSYWTKNATAFTIAGTVAGYPIQVRTQNGWYNFQHRLTGVTSVIIGGSGYIDEVRLYPADAELESYTYQPLIGMSSATDAKGSTTYYDYDYLQNLLDIKDLYGNILKSYQYNYAGYTPGMTPFVNAALQQSFTRATCGQGTGGTSVTYTVPANTYYSYVSQAAANDLAQSDINDNGQAYANANGGCAVMPCTAGTISSITNPSHLNYTFTYGASVGDNVIVRIFNSSGSQVAPPQGSLSISGGTISGSVPAADTYTFTLMVAGTNCPNGVTSTPTSLAIQ